MASGVPKIGVCESDGGENATANSEDERRNKNVGGLEVTKRESLVNNGNAPQLDLEEPPQTQRKRLNARKLRNFEGCKMKAPVQSASVTDTTGATFTRYAPTPDIPLIKLKLIRKECVIRQKSEDEFMMTPSWRRDNTDCNYGKFPWISDLFAPDTARPQPSVNEDSYGGGTGTSTESDQRSSDPTVYITQKGGPPEIGASECDDGDVDPTPQEACAKASHFGVGEGGEVAQYTEYIDNAKKTKNLLLGFEPQMNGDVGPDPAVASREGQERPSSVAQAPAHPEANLQPRTSAHRGNEARSIPQFGVWNTDPSQAQGYTGAFTSATQERRPGPYNDTPRNYGRAPWIRGLFVDCCRHQPSVHEDAYGGGSRTRFDQIGSEAMILLGNGSQDNVASTTQNLMPTMSTIHQPEQKPTKQKGRQARRFYWFRRSNDERNVVP